MEEDFAFDSYNNSDAEDNSGTKTREMRFIVDRDIVDTGNEGSGIFLSINDALKAARLRRLSKKDERLKIKITSNLYEESLCLDIPGIVIEPKEKGGEVTILTRGKPCIIVDVGEGNHVTIKQTRMLLLDNDSGSEDDEIKT